MVIRGQQAERSFYRTAQLAGATITDVSFAWMQGRTFHKDGLTYLLTEDSAGGKILEIIEEELS